MNSCKVFASRDITKDEEIQLGLLATLQVD